MTMRSTIVASARRAALRFGYRIERVDRGPVQSPLQDAQVWGVLERVYEQPQRPERPGRGATADSLAEYAFAIDREQGNLVYLLGRALGATRAVDFATSFGVSALYLAAAVRDNGGGIVIGSEIVPQKVVAARRNLADAGLADFVEIRVGDARETLCDLGGPVDLAVIDGWGPGDRRTIARDVIELVAPQLRRGGIAINDNGERDYLEFVRDPGNGFRSMRLPVKRGTELSVRVEGD